MAKILVVEDEKNLSEHVALCLETERHVVEVASNGVEALELLRAFDYELVLLDVGLPGMSGVEVLKNYRSGGGKARVLMLTGKGEIDDKEAGFSAGADDYLTKPFDQRELLMRVRALLKRDAAAASDHIEIGKLKLDSKALQVQFLGKPIKLAPQEFALLEFLMRHPNEVFSADALLNRVWRSDEEATIDSVRMCITRLRAKLKTDEDKPIIATVFGSGYKLDVEPLEN